MIKTPVLNWYDNVNAGIIFGAEVECVCGYKFKARNIDCSKHKGFQTILNCPKCGAEIIGHYKIWLTNKKK